jgi:Hydrazine synthase alpha subunit middle domain
MRYAIGNFYRREDLIRIIQIHCQRQSPLPDVARRGLGSYSEQNYSFEFGNIVITDAEASLTSQKFYRVRIAPWNCDTNWKLFGMEVALICAMILKRIIFLMAIAAVLPLQAGPTNSILFVTQVPIPGDFTSIGSTFGNQRATPDSCGRGGDLYVRYPDGTIKNLTRAAGYGKWGAQFTNGIAVRQPSVYWDGKKAVFSMVVGAPGAQYDYATVSYWQLYEITNFTDPASAPIITKITNQPTNYDNVAPIYGTDDRIIFASDRPRNGQRNLYPQLDEYEEAPTVTGLWSLQPTNGDLFMLSHTPSGAFSPSIDSSGRVIFIRWDHLQRDQQADTDVEEGHITYGAFNWSDESTNSVTTTNLTELFPEPRPVRNDLLAGTGLTGHVFNQFFPWQINEDGTAEETVNHVGRHELGGSYLNAAFNNDTNIQDLYYFGNHYNTNILENILEIREDPRTPGLFYGISAPEFGTHAAGQLISLTGGTNLNASAMRVDYLTPLSTRFPASGSNSIPADHTGFYRNPVMTADGYLIASHTAWALADNNGGSTAFPSSKYDFRLKTLQSSNGFYVPGTLLTAGLTNRAAYWDPDALVTQTNVLWELDPVEVVGRVRPARLAEQVAAPERDAFSAAGVDMNSFQSYLRAHELALIVSRDLTTRDHADRQQPFNLRVAGTTHQTIGAAGKIYDIAWMQLFQADQLRGLNHGSLGNPGNGRRVIAQNLHEPAVDNPSTPDTLIGSVRIASDGSQAAIVPARRGLTWQLTDTNGVGVVRERYWLTFAAGEIRTCTSCHGINQTTQANGPVPTNTPLALVQLLTYWKTNTTVGPSVATSQSTNYFQITFVRRPAESGVTYHVQQSTNLVNWVDIASYAGSNIVLTPQSMEVSRIGSPNENVTVRETSGMNGHSVRYLRVNVTRP